jgi:ribose 5-phosphate isomerase B
MSTSSIAIAADHAGFALKATLIEHFEQHGLPYDDLGVYSTDAVDYPDVAHNLCSMIYGTDAMGILICGTGIGMSIVANRHDSVRCALAVTEEMGRLARSHTDANILALGARIIDESTAIAIVDAFLNTDYEGGRHDSRLCKINVSIGMDAWYEPPLA